MSAFFIGLDTAIALLKRYRTLLLVGPLLLALGVQSCRLSSANSKLDKASGTIAQMEIASEVARQAQITLNAQNAQLSQRIAGDAQARHVENRAAVSRAIADYAAANGLRKACGSLPRQAYPAPVPSGPGTPDSPDADEVLAIPRDDFEALARDAMQAGEARAFLIDLVNSGLAVVDYPEPEFGR